MGGVPSTGRGRTAGAEEALGGRGCTKGSYSGPGAEPGAGGGKGEGKWERPWGGGGEAGPEGPQTQVAGCRCLATLPALPERGAQEGPGSCTALVGHSPADIKP